MTILVDCAECGHVRPYGGPCHTCRERITHVQRLLPHFDVPRNNERLTPRPRPLDPHEKTALADIARIYRGSSASPAKRTLGAGCEGCGRAGPRLTKGLCWKCQRDRRTPRRPRLWGT